jgi:3-oxoacyl-[acyl-carrier protein] reductase
MNIDLKGKVALVTGSGSGIGRGIAVALASCGADVAIHYRSSRKSAEDTASLIRSMGCDSEAFYADVSLTQDIHTLLSQVSDKFGRPLDILVNNAGHLVKRVANLDMTEEHYQQVMDVNLKSCVFACKLAAQGMLVNKSGCIVNISSIAAHNGGGSGASIYAASKAAMIAYSKGLAKELAPYGIRVNCVSPGVIGETNFHDTFTPEHVRSEVLKSIPLRREGTASDVAHTVVYLASEMSSYITGETIEINGGMYMR